MTDRRQPPRTLRGTRLQCEPFHSLGSRLPCSYQEVPQRPALPVCCAKPISVLLQPKPILAFGFSVQGRQARSPQREHASARRRVWRVSRLEWWPKPEWRHPAPPANPGQRRMDRRSHGDGDRGRATAPAIGVGSLQPETSRHRYDNRRRSACRTGADERSRTSDLLITNQLLYQLSYIGADRKV